MSLQRPEFSTFQDLFDAAQGTPEKRAAWLQRRQEQEQAEVDKRVRDGWMRYASRISDLGERFAARTFENYNVPPGDAKALATAMELVEDVSRGAWFYGTFGIGKSHLGGATVHALLELKIPATFVTAGGLIDRLKATYDKTGNVRDGESDIIRNMVQIPYLFVDDLDKIVLTEWSAQKLYMLVNGRYEAKRGIGLSSNLSPSDLRIQWAKRLARNAEDKNELLPTLIGSIYDRLIEMTTIVRVVGESQRESA